MCLGHRRADTVAPMSERAEEVDDGFEARCAGDRAFLGLEITGDRPHASFLLTSALARHDGRLYGGTAVAAAIAMAEHASGRPCLWTTVQFVSGDSVVGDRIECEATVLAAGRRTTQLRVSGSTGGRELFSAVGSTAVHKERALDGVFEPTPAVAQPDDCDVFHFPIPKHMVEHAERERARPMELRATRRLDPSAGRDGELLFWARVAGRRATPAMIGYMADMVPMSVVHATGHLGGGTSLDNTVRIGRPADTEWVLLQLDPHIAIGGYGHGSALVWSPDGVLMATASQTAALIVLD